MTSGCHQRNSSVQFQNLIEVLKCENEHQISCLKEPAELIDSLCWELFKRPMRIVIPENLTRKEDIAPELEKYLARSITDLESTLHAGNVSESGFIVENQSIVDVIWNDCVYLKQNCISRYQLADYLEITVLHNSIQNIKEMEKDYELSESTKELLSHQELNISTLLDKYRLERNSFTHFLDSNFEFQSVSYAHKQADPFHPSMDNPSITASTEYFLLCTKHPQVTTEHKGLHSSQWPCGSFFRFSDLSLSLIRRFGFFQGPGVPHRLDPQQLCMFFGLLK